MGEILHTSHIKIVRDKGPVRRAYIENFSEPVMFGVHGKIASFYNIEPEVEIPSTLDHIISGVGG
ncbi:MAG: hypothetical protein GY786_24790 [Proteobacteria bacterium]|nr:hypothetical protein [Pseudomonadota bacterium]